MTYSNFDAVRIYSDLVLKDKVLPLTTVSDKP